MKLKSLLMVGALAGLVVCQATAVAQDIVLPKVDTRNYSPYPEQTLPNRVLFGDTHLHTSYSTDVGMAGALVGPEDAFRFARGEEVKSTTGLRAKLRRPLDWFGKAHILEPSAEGYKDVLIKSPVDPKLSTMGTDLSAAGLAGVWVRENTREAIWDAMARKEVYGSTGTRMQVRVFAGWDFKVEDLDRSDFAAHGYKGGVPMGGDLKAAPVGKAPTFLVRALRDADGANLDRVQIVKGWLDASGKTQEKLTAYWKEPSFNPNERAFYYARVIEIPTPRWLAYDAKFYGVKIPEGVKMSSQERAYTSPIWYTPAR